MALRICSAGAAQGLVNALREAFRANAGADIEATFGAVGSLRAKLLEGAPCDAVILTAAMIAGLEADARVVRGTSAPLGRVRTGVAIRIGDPVPPVADRKELAAMLLAASALYVPDTVNSTAGVHVAGVLDRLGIRDAVAPRIAEHPNGATAMRALAQTTLSGAVGCTQITEILDTPGVALVGPLPAEFELVTVYAVAVWAAAREPALARQFAGLLTAPSSRSSRTAAGFE